METIINSDAFLIVISGVLIFTFQKLVSQLYISPVVDFIKCLAKIEMLLNRYAFLCGYEYGTNGGGNDSDVEYFRKELRDMVSEMLGCYYILPYPMKIWFEKIRKIDIYKAKPEMLMLSFYVSTRKDILKQKSRAKIAIKNIPEYLNFSQIKYEMADM